MKEIVRARDFVTYVELKTLPFARMRRPTHAHTHARAHNTVRKFSKKTLTYPSSP